jgi:hypothetical protein
VRVTAVLAGARRAVVRRSPVTWAVAIIATVAVSWVTASGALALSTPTISATASGSGPLGGVVYDEARLEGGSQETGSVEFLLYGPGDTSCSGEPEQSQGEEASGPGPYSVEFFPQSVGEYSYVVRYGGDANNAPASTTCGQPSQQLRMTPGRPSLVTTASTSFGSIEDSALLSGGVPTSGTIVFKLFGPDDAACGGTPVFVSSLPVSYQGHYSSGPFAPSLPGVYRFDAEYSGDANDDPATTACGDPGETVNLPGVSHPTLTQRTVGNATVGEQITDTASISGGLAPTGTVRFELFAPTDTGCSHGALIISTVAVVGDGSYSSDPFTASALGDYRYTATYSGDGLNAPAATICDDSSSVVTVSPLPAPALGRSFTVAPVSGTVRVQAVTSGAHKARAASAGFVELRSPRSLPIGSTVDTLRGIARITTATGSFGHTQSGLFTGSAFVVNQNRDRVGLTRLHLLDREASLCTTPATAPRLLASLHARGSGHYLIEGRYSSASDRGTVREEVQDRCDGTLTRVFRGTVVVRDRSGRKITLRAGMRYLASAAVPGTKICFVHRHRRKCIPLG